MTLNIKWLEKLKDIEISVIKVKELRKAYSGLQVSLIFSSSDQREAKKSN